jgi:hypothetical protein
MTELPELPVGAWLWFPRMGAYTSAAGSNFNGMALPDVIYLQARGTPPPRPAPEALSAMLAQMKADGITANNPPPTQLKARTPMWVPADQIDCPICFESGAPFRNLSCEHAICVRCGENAANFGRARCPLCPAPHLLNVSQLLSTISKARDDYRAWREGSHRNAALAASEPGAAHGRLSAGLKDEARTLHHKTCGLLQLASPKPAKKKPAARKAAPTRMYRGRPLAF